MDMRSQTRSLRKRSRLRHTSAFFVPISQRSLQRGFAVCHLAPLGNDMTIEMQNNMRKTFEYFEYSTHLVQILKSRVCSTLSIYMPRACVHNSAFNLEICWLKSRLKLGKGKVWFSSQP
jgi:hypothetical protein